MKRTKEAFVATLGQYVPLEGKRILEIGCGTGNYTRQIAPLCRELVAVDPDSASIRSAQEFVPYPNISFYVRAAEDLHGIPEEFDVVIFTLSLHHVPTPLMPQAIDEAVRVLSPGGYIVFLEPTEHGTFFEAELAFEACDGDERESKRQAYDTMQKHPKLQLVAERDDQTEFQWDSLTDFNTTMHPKADASRLDLFLRAHGYSLTAKRRINIYRIRS